MLDFKLKQIYLTIFIGEELDYLVCPLPWFRKEWKRKCYALMQIKPFFRR